MNATELTWEDLPSLMDELKEMARRLLCRESNAHSLGAPTELVLTALRRQRRAGQNWTDVTWNDRDHLFGSVYRAMREALIDHARRRSAQKRAHVRTYLDPADMEKIWKVAEERPQLLEPMLNAVSQLEEEHPSWAAALRHRFFGALELEEIAGLLECNEKSVRRWIDLGKSYILERVNATGERDVDSTDA